MVKGLLLGMLVLGALMTVNAAEEDAYDRELLLQEEEGTRIGHGTQSSSSTSSSTRRRRHNHTTTTRRRRHTHAATSTTSTASASSRCGGTKGTPAYKGPCCPVGSGHKGNLYNALLRETGGLQAGGADPSKWINVCNTPTASSNTGFSAYLFFVAEDSGGNNVVKQCNYQTGDNLNLGTSGRILLKDHTTANPKTLDWTCLSRETKFAVRVPLPGKANTVSLDADTYAGFAQVKMIKLNACVTKPGTDGSPVTVKKCAEKKIILECNQASCNGDLSSPQYGCKSSTGAVAGITSDTLGWTGRNNCAKMAKIAAGLIP